MNPTYAFRIFEEKLTLHLFQLLKEKFNPYRPLYFLFFRRRKLCEKDDPGTQFFSTFVLFATFPGTFGDEISTPLPHTALENRSKIHAFFYKNNFIRTRG